jgi:16S rRNA processing protein RimM
VAATTCRDRLRPGRFSCADCASNCWTGTVVGEIASVLRMPAQEVLVVRGADREHLVPNVAPIVVSIDPEAGVMRIDPPEGLLEI